MKDLLFLIQYLFKEKDGISIDGFSFPKGLAAEIAVSTVKEYLEKYDEYFNFVLFCAYILCI